MVPLRLFFISDLRKISAASSEVVGGQFHEEVEAVQSEMSRLEDPVVQAENPLWIDRSEA